MIINGLVKRDALPTLIGCNRLWFKKGSKTCVYTTSRKVIETSYIVLGKKDSSETAIDEKDFKSAIDEKDFKRKCSCSRSMEF